jgi:hypothetical protein
MTRDGVITVQLLWGLAGGWGLHHYPPHLQVVQSARMTRIEIVPRRAAIHHHRRQLSFPAQWRYDCLATTLNVLHGPFCRDRCWAVRECVVSCLARQRPSQAAVRVGLAATARRCSLRSLHFRQGQASIFCRRPFALAPAPSKYTHGFLAHKRHILDVRGHT